MTMSHFQILIGNAASNANLIFLNGEPGEPLFESLFKN